MGPANFFLALGVLCLLGLDIEHWGGHWLLLRALGAAVGTSLCAVKSPSGTLGHVFVALCSSLAAVRHFVFCEAPLGSMLLCVAASIARGMQYQLCAISPAPGYAHHLLCPDAAHGILSFAPLWIYAVTAIIHLWPYLPFCFTEQIIQQCLRVQYYACLHCYVQWLRCGMLLRQLIHWFMRPYLAVYQHETRQEVIRRAHKAGLFLKSSTLKHQLLTPRQQTQPIRRQNPVVPTPHHLRLLAIITFLLSASTVAVAGGTGRTGFATAATSLDAVQLVTTNLHHLALMDPGNAFELLHTQRQATPACTALLRSPVVPRSMKRTSPDHPYHGVWLQEQARAAKNAQARAAGSANAGQAPPSNSEQAHTTVDDFSPEGPVQIDPTLQYWTDPDNQWVIGNHPQLTPAIREQLQAELLGRRDSCFAYQMSDLTGYKGEKFKIELKHDRPIMQKPRRHAPLEMDIQDTKCVELHDVGFIVASSKNCQYASNATMPAKKDADGNWTDFRFCLDYRNINEATVADHYGMHLPEQLFACVAGSTFFSKIDLRGAFHQILIDEESQQYTSFFWRNQQFNYTRLPYGLKNGPAALQRIMDREIGTAGLRDVCTCFIDDLLVHSKTAEEHLAHVCAVLDMLKACGLKAHPAKSCFFADTVEYLGHYISANGLTPHQAKIAAVAGLRVPTNVSELRSVLGFLNYYRCYVQNFSAIAAPLNHLLGNEVPWQWTSVEHNAYQALKDAMCRPGAALKHFDRDRPAIVYADWSKAGVAAVLAQVDDDGNEYMVACVSRSLNKHERNYCSYEGEMLAGVWGVKSFRQYLFGCKFTLISDHQPLKWLMQSPSLAGKHMRWAMSMQEFDFDIQYRPGPQHVNVDVPSRDPLAKSYDSTGACLDPELTPTAAVSVHSLPAFNPATELTMSCYVGQTAHVLQQAAAEGLGNAGRVDGFMDAYAPTATDLLAGHLGKLSDPLDVAPSAPEPAAAAETRQLRGSAGVWLGVAAPKLMITRHEPVQDLVVSGRVDAHGVANTVEQLSTARVGPALAMAAMGEGIVLYEPFGGIAAGLEAALANGMRIRRYLYSDTAEPARVAARARVLQLHYKYPHLLPVSAFAESFEVLPHNVRQVNTQALIDAGALMGEQWLIVAGWPCEDLSAAGKGAGLAGNRSSHFVDTVRIIAALQQLQPDNPPAWVLENTSMQAAWNHAQVREVDFPYINSILGTPVLLDAARFGAFAYRLRNWWSNIADPHHVAAVADVVQRAAGRYVNDVLDPGRVAQVARSPQQHPFYRCNANRGQPLEALPTLVAYTGSRAFRDEGMGLVFDSLAQCWLEPNPDERERIMGYATGTTDVEGVDYKERHELLGRAMDRHTTTALFAIYLTLATSARHVSAAALVLPMQAARTVPPKLMPSMPWACTRCQDPTGCQACIRMKHRYGSNHLQRCGWVPVQPLSPTAIQWPVAHDGQLDRAGLGYSTPTSLATVAVHGGGVYPQDEIAPLCEAGLAKSAVPAGRGLFSVPEQAALQYGAGPEGEVEYRQVHAAVVGEQPAVVPDLCPADEHAVRPDDGFSSMSDFELYVRQQALAVEASVVDSAVSSDLVKGSILDVHDDTQVLQFLATKQLPAGLDARGNWRIQKRARHFQLNGTELIRVMADGTRLIVPPPNQRVQLIKQMHEQAGHFGVKRTKNLLQSSYWWVGMERDVVRTLATCDVCSQIRANFSVANDQLHPLPIRGMFFRWGVDLCGPFITSDRGNAYIMVCIEHFSKNIEVIPIPNKTAETTAYAFLSHVIGRYGGCAEVVTDRGTEFEGKFHQVLEECMITHRTTSANHPQANGLAERCVQTIKSALAKHCAQRGAVADWDWALPRIALGYRASKQAASGLSPYEMMYGCPAIVPPAVADRFRTEWMLRFDTRAHRKHAANYLLMRSELLRHNCTLAMGNLDIAQERDTQRYKTVRSGLYRSPTVLFVPGQYVHVRRPNVMNTLQSGAQQTILRVLEVRDSGVLVLQGKCGSTMSVHKQNCAPCHLTNIDQRMDYSSRRVGEDFSCVKCGSSEDEAIMLICDGCGGGFHTYCLDPPLAHLPDAPVWVCPGCQVSGPTVEQILAQRGTMVVRGQEPVFMPHQAQRAADKYAHTLGGRTLTVGKKAGVLEFVDRKDRPVKHKAHPLRLVRAGMADKWYSYDAACKALSHEPANALAVAMAELQAQHGNMPEGYVFVMGDNRNHSDDSRGSVGFLETGRILGKAVVRFWPINKMTVFTRPDVLKNR